ncbi:hypothetical protein ACM1RC_27435 [Paenibacillus azoreducens]|uniref:hypothetical protein n=1 Tax=Paenibacillus azoreducens TaxID=116718 RepID=UPI0039F4F2D2
MKPKTLKNCEREMKHTWESFRWLYKDKLVKLDFMTRRMMAEFSSLSIPNYLAREYVQEEFAKLWDEVAREEDAKYGSNGIRIGGK